uniref:Uncharacterized protein n=1 Tax=Drosophila-associated filamentous virus TaxID=2743186 RepID=A0A6M9U017_9VIRU|nr:putative protein 40 [Drosophila-associated filamentous virus]
MRRFYIEIDYDVNVHYSSYLDIGKVHTKMPNNGFINIGQVQNRVKNLNILKNQKINISTINHGNCNYTHILYVALNDECIIQSTLFQYVSFATIFKNTTKRNKNNILSVEFFIMHRNETYDGLKLCNPDSQKALVNTNLSLSERYPDYKPKMITSAFTLFGRMPIAQLLRMNFTACPSSSDQSSSQILYGDNAMCILKNITIDYKNVNQMRFDNLTINMLQLNNAQLTIYNLLQRSFHQSATGQLLPHSNANLLKLLLTLLKDVKFNTFENKQYTLSTL